MDVSVKKSMLGNLDCASKVAGLSLLRQSIKASFGLLKKVMYFCGNSSPRRTPTTALPTVSLCNVGSMGSNTIGANFNSAIVLSVKTTRYPCSKRLDAK